MQIQLLSIQDVADTLNISYATAREIIHSGEVRTVRVGKRLRVTSQALENYLNGDAK